MGSWMLSCMSSHNLELQISSMKGHWVSWTWWILLILEWFLLQSGNDGHHGKWLYWSHISPSTHLGIVKGADQVGGLIDRDNDALFQHLIKLPLQQGRHGDWELLSDMSNGMCIVMQYNVVYDWESPISLKASGDSWMISSFVLIGGWCTWVVSCVLAFVSAPVTWYLDLYMSLRAEFI